MQARCRGFEARLSFAAVPMYDYRCERCSVQFEVRQSFSEDSLSVCPPEGGPASCVAPGEGPVKKVFSGVAIAFKGDGFYKNDHGANAKGRRKERESDSSKDSSGSSSSKESSKEPASKDSSSKESSSKDSSSSSSGGRAKADASTSSSSS